MIVCQTNFIADIDARVRDATRLEAAAVPTEGVDVIVKVFSRGVLAPEDVTRLRDLGGGVDPVIDLGHRHTATAFAETEEVSQ